MPTFLQDDEFGQIAIKRTSLARSVRLKINAAGAISITLPRHAPLHLAKQLLEQARLKVRRNLAEQKAELTILRHGDMIGKSHRLIINQGPELSSRLVETSLQVTLPADMAQESAPAQTYIKQSALKALRKQARAYLTRRLEGLATEHQFGYTKVRFSNAGTRWGSCSTGGTISLNIWLMQLPFELIDYVIIHELCHTRQMNHSPQFWGLVEALLPNYKVLRRNLKAQHPYL